ncbi:MAG TPA: methyltransferase [Desulfotignum sp.]|nr:methyltransferase [Desulfotignum sp.]
METYTADTLSDPPLTLFQPRSGYRFSLDSLILAAHILPAPGSHLVDVGCGCGIISLILAARHPDLRVTGVEIQKTLAGLARKNSVYNRLAGRVRIMHQDARTLAPDDVDAPVDIVVSNPPYGKKGGGRTGPDPGRALARHEIFLDIATLAHLAHRLSAPRGRLFLIFPAGRATDLDAALAAAGFQVVLTRSVHFMPQDLPRRVLVCAAASGRGAVVCPPLFLYHGDGTPTPDHAALLHGGFLGSCMV